MANQDVNFFDIAQELADNEEAKLARVNEALTDSQRALDYGDFVYVLTPSIFSSPMAVGKIMTENAESLLDEVVKDLRDKGISEEQTQAFFEVSEKFGSEDEERLSYEAGYRMTMVHTVEHPHGHLKRVHISRLFPITEEEYGGLVVALSSDNPRKVLSQPWMQKLQWDIINVLESRPGSPQRARCGDCFGKRTAMIYDYTGRIMVPYVQHADGTFSVGDHGEDQIGNRMNMRLFCLECHWESEEIDMNPDEVNLHGVSAMEALYKLNDDVL